MMQPSLKPLGGQVAVTAAGSSAGLATAHMAAAGVAAVSAVRRPRR